MTPLELKEARRTLGLNQVEMARSLGVSRAGYLHWERGERQIPGICRVAVELLLWKDAVVMRAIKEKITGMGTN